MVELARHQNPCDHITFHTKIDPADLILYADENPISQVVINLLKNAIQAIGNQPDGQIDIQVYCNETEEVLIEIKNNGPVIPPESAEHIFIPFFTTKKEAAESDLVFHVRLCGFPVEASSCCRTIRKQNSY